MHPFLLPVALCGTGYAIHICLRHKEKVSSRTHYNDGDACAEVPDRVVTSIRVNARLSGARPQTRAGDGVLGLELESELHCCALGP